MSPVRARQVGFILLYFQCQNNITRLLNGTLDYFGQGIHTVNGKQTNRL
jgi:hypothetical protein